MTSFGSKTFTWAGRKLTKITSGSNTYTYGYNEAGIRASKTVNGTTTEYLLNGDQILAQEKDNKVMWFFYDSQGQRVGLNYDGYDYYYIYNPQGDVVGIMRRATGEIVATYEYDAWGKCTKVNGEEIGVANPFRYRGYYYDTESGLYYLNSRYYNPEIGRFINADVS